LKIFLAIKLQAREIRQNVSVIKPCPNCHSTNIQKDGTRKTTMGKKQRWICLECNKRFVLDPIQKIKGNWMPLLWL
jgi:transposase-like protein